MDNTTTTSTIAVSESDTFAKGGFLEKDTPLGAGVDVVFKLDGREFVVCAETDRRGRKHLAVHLYGTLENLAVTPVQGNKLRVFADAEDDR